MNDLNLHRIIGRVGKDPETTIMPDNTLRAAFSVATGNRWTDNAGNKQEKTQWHNIVAWGKTAELVKEFVKAGMKVHVEGPSETRDFLNRDGGKSRTTEIVLRGMGGDRIDFLSRAPAKEPG